MTIMSKREYLIALKKKYFKAKKKTKSQLLNDFCDFTQYHRKYAVFLLNNPVPKKWKRYASRKRKYDQTVIDALLTLWRASNEICAERFHPFIPTILDKMLQLNKIKITAEVQTKLLEISLASVKRILKKTKHRSKVKISGTTKPGSLLKKQIKTRFGRWNQKDPGWFEIDTVAHCGSSIEGEFIYSLNLIDIATGWSEQGAIWGKGELATQARIKEIKDRLPFKMKGLDPDNGGEFINWHLFRYCKKNDITLTRSRPYRKNDNAHIEQKNYTAIRQLVGYVRLEKRVQQHILNDLYRKEWRLYLNFFQPTLKLKERIKDVVTGKSKKKYHKAKTPYQRLIEHPKVSVEIKEQLKAIYDKLDPIELQLKIKKKLELLKRTLR